MYRVAWGPAIVPQSSFTQEPFQLYSVGDGVVLQHAPADLDARASDVMSFLRQENLITDVIFYIKLQHFPTYRNFKNYFPMLLDLCCVLQKRVPIHSEISWKRDYSAVAVGNDDG